MTISRLWTWLLVLPLLSSCLNVIKPGDDYAPPATTAPDYSQPESWAALPSRLDSADAVPQGSGLSDQQATAAADVFFVHPTTYYRPRSWNGDVRDEQLNRFTDQSTIRKQASAFNAAGRIYAPRYRQATLFAFFDSTANGKQALDFAYQDVRSAFQYYLRHHNQGRPIILAGHSQGTFHARRLLREFFDQDPQLRRRLVAAYLIGFSVQASSYQTLRPCADSLQTSCYVAWNTAEWGHDYLPFRDAVVVNPLTWTQDTAAAPASLNQGGIPFSFDRIDRHVADAKIRQGVLWLHAPQPSGYPRFLLPGKSELRHSFHIADYALYWMNVRRNAVARVQAWQRQQ